MSQVNDALRISSQILHRNGKMTLIQTTRDWLTQHCLGTCFPLQTSIIFCSVCIVWSLSWRSMDFKQEDMTVRWQHVAMIGIYYLYIYIIYTLYYIISYHIITNNMPCIWHVHRTWQCLDTTRSSRSKTEVFPRRWRDIFPEKCCATKP